MLFDLCVWLHNTLTMRRRYKARIFFKGGSHLDGWFYYMKYSGNTYTWRACNKSVHITRSEEIIAYQVLKVRGFFELKSK
jgi:hypothetical protein